MKVAARKRPARSEEEQPSKKKRSKLPEGAIEFRIRLIRDAQGQLQVDGRNCRIRPDLSPPVANEAVQAIFKWLKFAQIRSKMDRSVAPLITAAVENAGEKLTQAAVGAVFEKIFGNRTSR